MLEKPDIQDKKIITCLQVEYGLRIIQIAFLPLGGNLCTAVYRAVAEDGMLYFCKLRCSDFDEISVELPRFLSEQGITQIIPPLPSNTGQLWAKLEAFHVILYPFVEGTSGFQDKLTEGQWADFGAALQRIHTLSLPPALRQKMQKENYSPESRDICREVLQRLESERFNDSIMAGLASFLLPKRETILNFIGHAERLAQALASRSTELVLCHSDIHPGNLFIDKNGALFIVDWDSPVLAPKERDLMFIGGGQGYVGVNDQEEEAHFYRYYNLSAVDPVAMAYYRYERNLYDLSVECPRIFSSTLNAQDRARSLEIVTWLFLPGSSIEMAHKSGRLP
ncbi:MAG TPA: phosphotransferase [Anaerolineales bacterium]|nr:phosphotransferase [Anaerolineales bacterium]